MTKRRTKTEMLWMWAMLIKEKRAIRKILKRLEAERKRAEKRRKKLKKPVDFLAMAYYNITVR